ncbi:DEAD/DEAH box helicase [Novosphingopyxis sp.]|uniref:DEAD/DEAH box helicase n=1 Tax=Novosphingopyxis sp. TaxID=2709690 RepID=UPI003B5953B1
MVDFDSLNRVSSANGETDPRKIFQKLIKPDGVNELYASQSELLDRWYRNKDVKDTILKLPTGGGKSLVGLLQAQSSLNELKQPALYLTPTRQLMKQVCDEADSFGIKAKPYLGASEGIDPEIINGQCVGILTYEAVFNGLSKFGTRDKRSEVGKCGLVILDDAHAAFESVWDSFSFVIKQKNHKDLYNEICSEFREAFKQLNRAQTFDEIVSGKEHFVLDVPHWDWLQQKDAISQIIQAYGPENIDRFSWPHIRDELHVCQVLISRKSVSIVPLVPLTDRAFVFDTAKRRIFMSATIADDSEIVRNLGVSAQAANNPLVAASLAGVGERMILSPALIKPIEPFDSTVMVKQLLSEVKKSNKNVAILTPSFEAAMRWDGIAQVPKKGDETEVLIERLRTTKGLSAVLPRRYDGVDLPGESCRVLILDGLPYGNSDYDSWRIDTFSYGAGSVSLAQRIEQAIGRGARGTSDYCVVLLTGSDLINWIGVKSNQKFLSAGTLRQLEIGLEVSKAVNSPQDFVETAWKCLNRDSSWRSYHAAELGDAAVPVCPSECDLQMRERERAAIDALRVRQFTNALSELDKAIDLATDQATKGWFHQLKSRALMQHGDDVSAEQSQVKAHGLNSRLTGPRGQVPFVAVAATSNQGASIVAKINQYHHVGVAQRVFDDAAKHLSAIATANQFETALQTLFEFIGFSASRPDDIYRKGPDVLAATEGTHLIIEAKSRRRDKNKLTKTLHGQVMNHENWFDTNYGVVERKQRIIVYPTNKSEKNAGADHTLALTFATIDQIVQSARQAIKEIGSLGEDQKAFNAQRILIDKGLEPDGIIQRLSQFTFE